MGLAPEVLRAKAVGEKLFEGGLDEGIGTRPHEDTEGGRVAELAHHLPAYAAWRAQLADGLTCGASDHGDRREVPMPVEDGAEKRRALGAIARRIGRVFDIAHAVHGPIGAQQRRTDGEVRIRGILVFPSRDGSSHKFKVVHDAPFIPQGAGTCQRKTSSSSKLKTTQGGPSFLS